MTRVILKTSKISVGICTLERQLRSPLQRENFFQRSTQTKKARLAPRLICSEWNEDYSSSPPFFLGVFFFRAAPRISPRLAPLSDEPNCATASFSSEISRALMESETFRLPFSTPLTRAATSS